MKKSFLKTAAIASIVLASGCASIINDKEQTVNILSSNGQKVEGTIRGLPFQAPAAVSLERGKRDVQIIPTTAGCQPTTIESGVAPFFWGNILTGGLLGSATDAVSEKMWEYDETVTIICS
jgi:hypothetical protein